ncbi:hypothetical protein CDLVIII_4042 [Clostridium sp. DL-VIII]|uniref:DUF2971 domain-containing protein n=1 Tax=Clostridium sp. DL-VIII TaxID=641107 RepID=UPI00023AF8FA|nr:DUF2971 domain-containing protein [Clostridium sp. DL-VIII]EHJ00579.1 hypothetical protein CDLVIII_4042 [Clostridium sp. DL-VIII]
MWIKEYVKLNFPLDPNDLRIQDAIKLKHQNIPSSLYRYRKFNEWSLKNLIEEQERQSYPIEFNDPFDASLKINYEEVSKELFLKRNMKNIINELEKSGVDIEDKDLKTINLSDQPIYDFVKLISKFDSNLNGKEDEFAKILSEQTLNSIKEMFSKLRTSFQNGYLIVCFSELKDEVLMWSHYAENHTGFCIEYNFQELGLFNAQSRMLNPVIYTDELFDATQYILQPLILENHNFNNLFGIYSTISKSTKWSYEKEWRTVFPLGPGASEEDRFIKVPKPKALYVGAKSTEDNIRKLMDIAVIKEIPLYQIILSDTSHDLKQHVLYNPTES